MTMKNQDFTMTAGDSKYLDFTIEMDSSTLSGSTIVWAMTKYDSIVLEKTTTGGISITAAKVFRVTLDPEDTLTLVPGLYPHEAEVTDTNGDVSTVSVGTITIEKDSV
jgi:hypothetical protein